MAEDAWAEAREQAKKILEEERERNRKAAEQAERERDGTR